MGKKKVDKRGRGNAGRSVASVKDGHHNAVGSRWAVFSALLVATVAVLVYSGTLRYPFLFDDDLYILDNPLLKDLSNFTGLSGTRYVGHLSFALNYAVSGYDTFGYHLVNTIVHVINGLLVWWLVFLVLRTPVLDGSEVKGRFGIALPLVVALLFVAHPIQTQAVTYITQRFASMATLFYLASICFYMRARVEMETADPTSDQILNRRSVALLVLSFASAVLAMKTKEISFTLPFMAVLFEVIFFKGTAAALGRRVRCLAPLLVTIPIIPLTLFLPDFSHGTGVGEEGGVAEQIRTMQVEELSELSRHDYLVTQFKVVAIYIRLLFLPVRQNVLHQTEMSDSLFDPVTAASFVLLAAVLATGIYLLLRARRGRGGGYSLLAGAGIVWFFAAISIESSIIPIKDVMFEHRVYLPSVGWGLAVASATAYLVGRLRVKDALRVFIALAIAVTVTLAGAAYKRNLVWQSSVTLWEDMVSKSPGKPAGTFALGYAYYQHKRYDEAIEKFKEVIRAAPEFAEAHNNLGNTYHATARHEEAAVEYGVAIRYMPGDAKLHLNLGLAYADGGRFEEAVESYREALRLRPGYSAVRFHMGKAYYGLSMLDEAEGEFLEALKARPGDPIALNHLGNVYFRTGRLEEAVARYGEAARIAPDYAEAHLNLGLSYVRTGDRAKATRALERGLELKPGDERAKAILEQFKEERKGE